MSNRKIYRKIAKENKINLCEVKQAMQSALDYAFRNPNNPSIIKAYQNQVPRKGEVPTPDEFIKYAVQKLRNETYLIVRFIPYRKKVFTITANTFFLI